MISQLLSGFVVLDSEDTNCQDSQSDISLIGSKRIYIDGSIMNALGAVKLM